MGDECFFRLADLRLLLSKPAKTSRRLLVKATRRWRYGDDSDVFLVINRECNEPRAIQCLRRGRLRSFEIPERFKEETLMPMKFPSASPEKTRAPAPERTPDHRGRAVLKSFL